MMTVQIRESLTFTQLGLSSPSFARKMYFRPIIYFRASFTSLPPEVRGAELLYEYEKNMNYSRKLLAMKTWHN